VRVCAAVAAYLIRRYKNLPPGVVVVE